MFGCSEPPETAADVVRPLRVMDIGSAASFSGRSFPGRATAHQEVNLSFRVGGPLITLPAKVGDKVSIGDVLARLDPRDYEISVLNVTGELERAKAEHVLAEREYQRAVAAEAKNPDLISESELDKRLGARNRAKANVNALEASLQSAEDELGYTNLIAPFNGTIVNTFAENFEDVRFKQPILRLLDTTRLEFTINIPETLISVLPAIGNIEVVFDAFPDLKVPAEIDEIGSEASESTRTYPITLIMDQPGEVEILPGMSGKATGTANAELATENFRIVVPVTAIFSPGSDGSSAVWVIDTASNTTHLREIQVGRLVFEGIEVISGLVDGERIAIAGTNFLTEGQQVRPVLD
jgi:RND family efflux transporter MFP subunit